MRLMLATTNKGKLIELERIMGGQGFELVGLDDFESTEDIETGSTFVENALLKARHYHLLSGLPTIADDSGLEVDALGGAPGIFSARYGGPGATDADRVARLLEAMRDIPEEARTARFVCAAAIRWEGGEYALVGEVEGRILTRGRGEGGFGYDPVFHYEPLGRTFAELSVEEKGRVSHRGLAFGRLAAWLKDSRVLDTARAGDKIKFPARETSASFN